MNAPLIADIQRRVAEYFGIQIMHMLSRRRARQVTRPRQIAIYLAHELTGKTMPQIGRRFDRDHTTVMHACRVIEGLIAAGDVYGEIARDLLAEFTGKKAG